MIKITKKQEEIINGFIEKYENEVEKIEDNDIVELDIAFNSLAQNIVEVLSMGTIYSTEEESSGYPNIKKYLIDTEKGYLTIEVDTDTNKIVNYVAEL